MPDVTQNIQAIYTVDDIKELIIKDLLEHGVRDVTPDDIRQRGEWDNRPVVNDKNAIYVSFEGFEIRKSFDVKPVHGKIIIR